MARITARAIKRGESPDFTKCDEKLQRDFSKADSRFGSSCPVTNDRSAIQSNVSNQCTAVVAEISGTPLCGNGLVDAGEQCDGSNFAAATCSDFSFASGTLACTANCQLDLSGCVPTLCGNSVVDPGEDCDGGVGNTTCQDLGFPGGTLGCSPLCAYNVTSCNTPVCGNNVAEAGEACDGTDVNNLTCADVTGDPYGSVACTAGCTIDSSGCSPNQYADNLDGTISDLKSGLIWEKKVAAGGGGDVNNLHDADNLYRWKGICSVNLNDCQTDADCAAGETCDAADGQGTGFTAFQWVDELNNGAFGGHTDWRVPTRDELETLLDLTQATAPMVGTAFDGASCGSSCTDLTDPACSCTADMFDTWSSTPSAAQPAQAWHVDFYGGFVATNLKTALGSVRAVRTGP